MPITDIDLHFAEEPHILLIDDEPEIVELMDETLSHEGYRTTALTDPRMLEGLLRPDVFDVIVTDIHMPGMSGLVLLQLVKNIDPDLPVIIITGSDQLKHLMTSIRLGAHDYLRKPFSMNELLITVSRAVEKRALKRQIKRYYEQLEERVIEKTAELRHTYRRLEENLLGTILAMVNALEASDVYTRGHSERVTAISMMMGEEMGLDGDRMKTLRLGAVLHDVGKIGITHRILHKPEALTDDEYDVMKEHPAIGLRIIQPIDLDPEVFNIVAQHHERVDGGGYPHGLRGEAISPLSRIVAVADSFDAMTSDRPYRRGLLPHDALAELHRWAGVQFDGDAVRAFDSIFRRLLGTDLTRYNIVKENL